MSLRWPRLAVGLLFTIPMWVVSESPCRADPAEVASERPAAGSSVAIVDQPRHSGYFVGDVIAQRVLLEIAGRSVLPATLPHPGRVSAWFERRSVTIETDASSRRWLVVQYQILNAPPKLKTVTLPAWVLAVKDPAKGATVSAHSDSSAAASRGSNTGAPPGTALKIPAASINIAPLSPPGSPTQVGVADLRPDRSPELISTAPIRRAIAASSGALALTLVSWLGWIVWRNRRAIATQPFARALREMRSLDDREPRAWQVLHHAFDRTAGRVIQNGTLPELFERAPQLTPARVQIERFFTQSSQMFFARSLPEADSVSDRGGVSSSVIDSGDVSPRALCAELRRIERRHER